MSLKTLCISCKYYEGAFFCKAFPKEIPQQILTGENDHTKPLPNQKNDIVFEAIKQ
jgi:hypothetical protein